ncbi:bifunctional phosphoribosylaminoimidazolecarboxamide formyltransferase/IMP cyclohydrolase, partial [Candidatus Margulisiibacteriota bacterium]
LALRDKNSHLKSCIEHNIDLIDLVVVNLYPFEKTITKEKVSLEEAIENIDIGGPSMIRSAAKNYRSVGIIVNPGKYEVVLAELKKNKGELTEKTRKILACEAFQHTARYDSLISGFLRDRLTEDQEKFTEIISPVLKKTANLRYGENPHQKAALYKIMGEKGLADIQQLHGKELSYNNIIDLEAAWQIIAELELPGAAVIKHTNPCGAAIAEDLYKSYQKAYDSDPLSAFGSIVGLNKIVDLKTAKEIAKTFVEAVIAPDFDAEALKLLKKKPSIRLIKYNKNNKDSGIAYKHIKGGFLVQTKDNSENAPYDLKCVTIKKCTTKIQNDLLFANQIVKHVKSNAIVIVKEGQILGVGAGQMSRVDAMEIALRKAGKKAQDSALASDAFFPFKDAIELAAKAGVKAIIQPGGSKRDKEVIDCCNENNICMLTTGVRHFKH